MPTHIRIQLRLPLVAILAAIACSSAPARTLTLLEDAYEVGVDDVVLAGASPVTLHIRPCFGCRPRQLPLGSHTAFVGTAGRVTFEQFQTELASIRRRAGSSRLVAIFVFYRRDTNRVTRIQLKAD